MEQYFPVDPPQIWQVQNSKGQAVNVFEMPMAEARRVGIHNEGDVVTVIGRRGQWLHVRNGGLYSINADAWILAFQPGVGIDMLNEVGFGALNTASVPIMDFLTMQIPQQMEFIPLQQQMLVTPPMEYMPIASPPMEFVQVMSPQVEYLPMQQQQRLQQQRQPAQVLKERYYPPPPPPQRRELERSSYVEQEVANLHLVSAL
jgi:hypothetical protein